MNNRSERPKESAQKLARQEREQEGFDADFSCLGIEAIVDLPSEHPSVNLYGRVSDGRQNLRGQMLGSRRQLTAMNFRGSSFGEVLSITKTPPEQRPQLMRCLRDCQRRGVPLVIPCTSRLVRHPDYHAGRDPELRPTAQQVREVVSLARSYGVTVYSLNPPDASPPEDEAFLRELIAGVHGKMVGRPLSQLRMRRRQVKAPCVAYAKELREQGRSYREIAERLSKRFQIPLSKTAVCQWLKRG